MRKAVATTALVIALLAVPSAAQDEERLRALVGQLGSDDPEVRDAAESELSELGDRGDPQVVLHALESATDDADPEVRARCDSLRDQVSRWDQVLVMADEGLTAIHALSGRIEWTVSGTMGWFHQPPRSAPDYRRRLYSSHFQGAVQLPLDCLDWRTGKRIWTAQTDIPIPRILADGALVQERGWRLSRIDPESGRFLWETDLPREVSAGGSPKQGFAVDSSGVYVSVDGGRFGFDLNTGKERWRKPEPSWRRQYLDDGRLFAVSFPGKEVRLTRIDTETGDEVWSRDFQKSVGWWPCPSVQVAGGLVIATWRDEAIGVRALDIESGQPRWSARGSICRMFIDEGSARVWAASESSLLVLELDDGSEVARWDRALPGAHFFQVDARLVLVGFEESGDGPKDDPMSPTARRVSLTAYDLESLERSWESPVEGVIGTRSSGYFDVRVERIGSRIAFIADGNAESTVEVIDLGSGAVLARHVVGAR